MKIKVGVIFGGETVEHEVSIISAIQAMNHINEEKYALFIFTPEDGHLNFISSLILSQLAFIIDGTIPVTIFSNDFSDFIIPKKEKQDFNLVLSTDSVDKHVNKIKKFETIYLDRNSLIINDLELKPGDKIVVQQQNSDTHVLSKTKPFIYATEETLPSKQKETKKSKKKHKKK